MKNSNANFQAPQYQDMTVVMTQSKGPEKTFSSAWSNWYCDRLLVTL